MTYDQLVMFRAVVEQGGFAPAAKKLHVSQPSVSVAVKKLEEEFGIQLFSRESYRPTLTEAGQSFFKETMVALAQMERLSEFGRYLASGVEPVVRVAIGDLCPIPFVLELLKSFFAAKRYTHLDLLFEGVTGAEERVHEGDAAIGITPIMRSPAAFETVALGQIVLVPVCAPDFPLVNEPSPLDELTLRRFVQVIVRDTSRHREEVSFGVVHGALSYTVNDMQTKREIIHAGLGWGRLPEHLIRGDLASGTLVSLAERGIEPFIDTMRLVKRKDSYLGPTTEELWNYITSLAASGRIEF